MGWTYDVVLGFESEPDYAGSDDNTSEADLLARALYEDEAGHRYFASIGEAGAWWRLDDDWVLGTVLEFEPGRDNENPALQGLAEQEDTIEGQITLARRFGDFTLAGVLQPDALGRGKGFVTFAALGYDKMLGDSARLYSTVDVSFGDAEHMSTEFGIRRAKPPPRDSPPTIRAPASSRARSSWASSSCCRTPGACCSAARASTTTPRRRQPTDRRRRQRLGVRAGLRPAVFSMTLRAPCICF